MNALGRLPGEGPGRGRSNERGQSLIDVEGVGGGGGQGGMHGGSRGGMFNRKARRHQYGGPSESWVLAGLRWLARHQSDDGSFPAEAFSACCAPGTGCAGEGYKEHDVGVTSLAVLAFLGAGYTHLSRYTYEDPHTHQTINFGKTVKAAVRYLASKQDEDGCFGPRTGEFMYDHALGTLAVAEAYGMTNAAQYRPIAERGLDLLTRAQNPYRGWRYSVKPGDNDTSVTGWCVMALKSADISGLPSSRTGYDGAKSWIDSVTSEEGEVGYSGLGKIEVYVKGKNDAWGGHPSMTAIGLLCRIFMDKNGTDPRLAKHAARIVKDLPVWDEAKHTIDFYYWYYGTLALFQFDGPDGSYWKVWDQALREALGKHQKIRKDGCEDGSWDPAVDRWGFTGGRVYATAINVLTLEAAYRYENVLGGRRH